MQSNTKFTLVKQTFQFSNVILSLLFFSKNALLDSGPSNLTLLLLSTTCPNVLANSVDPDQLASEEASTVCH